MNEQVREQFSDNRNVSSNWIQITQPMIDVFGTNTLDPDPMHQDPVWAKQNSPFGKTVAYGFLTLSLLTSLFHDARKTNPHHPFGHPELTFLNYGFDRARLVTPVPAGEWIRGHFELIDDSRKTASGHLIMKIGCRVEIKNETAPALIAEWLAAGVQSKFLKPAANG